MMQASQDGCNRARTLMRFACAVCVSTASLAFACAASAATITVTTTADAGPGSLRAAVAAANTGDTVVLPASTGHYLVTSGEIQIVNPITIKGAGASGSVIAANGSSRVFEVTSGVPSGATVTFEGVTITGGAATTEPGGGGILVDSGQLDVIASTISGNTAGTATAPLVATTQNPPAGGGGIYNDGGTTRVSNSTISDNTTVISGGFCCHGGGAIYAEKGDVDIVNSDVSNNSASAIHNVGGTESDDDGGGAIHDDASTSNINVSHSTLNGNSTTVMDLGAAPGDTCCHGGGALYQDGTNITVVDSTLSGNTATLAGTGGTSSFVVEGGGAIYQDSRSTTLIGTTLSGNSASFSSSPLPTISGGGAFYTDSSNYPTDITNTTITGNTTNISGATNGGGGVYTDATSPGPLNLANATIAGNSATGAPGGGVYVYQTTMNSADSIVALNTAASGGADCDGTTPTLDSLGYNLDGAPDSCSFTAAGDQAVPAASVGLAPLANNGGPTMTRALLPGSAAIDGGNPAGCTDPSGLPLDVDQRGLPRPAGPFCDIGAYEFSPPFLTSPPVILGIAQVGQALFCSPGLFGGTPARSVGFKWNRRGASISGANGERYVPVAADAGQPLTCTETDTGDGSLSATSASMLVAATPASFGPSPLVSLRISRGVIKLPRGASSVSISVANRNSFAVKGSLQATTPAFGVISSALGATTRFSLPARTTKKVKLRFSKGIVKRLASKRRLVIQLTLSLRDPAGRGVTVNGNYLLERASRHHARRRAAAGA